VVLGFGGVQVLRLAHGFRGPLVDAVGEGSVLLAFQAETTYKSEQLPPHGATGPGHFALGSEAEAFDA
jgi:hypothetical protein